jgi:hypothetical protein
MYYNEYILKHTINFIIDVKALNKTDKIKKSLKWIFSGFSIFFIAILVFMIVHDLMTGESSNTTEYCAKYGFLASPGCW